MLCSHRWTGGAPAVRAACRSLHSAPICRCRAEPQQKDTKDSERGGLRAVLRERWAEVAQHERVLAVMASTALMMSGHGVMTPVLPLLADSLGATAAQLGMSLSAFAVARLVLNIPLGVLADRHGRRLLLVAGPLVNAVGMGGSGLAQSVTELLAWRVIAGAGNAAYLGGVQMYLNDICTSENRARVLGANHASLLFGVSLGPALGGIVAEHGGLQAPCAVVALSGVATAVYAYVRLPETLPASKQAAAGGAAPEEAGAEKRRQRWAMLTDTRLLAAGAANASTFALRQGGRNVLVVLLATGVHGYSAATLGSLFSAIALVDLLLIYPAASLADRVEDSRKIVVPALLLQAGALSAMSCSGSSQPLFLGTLAVWALGAAALGPAIPAYANDVIPPAQRGLGIALFRSAGDIGFVGAPILVGALVDLTSVEMGLRGLGLMVTASACTYALGATPPGVAATERRSKEE